MIYNHFGEFMQIIKSFPVYVTIPVRVNSHCERVPSYKVGAKYPVGLLKLWCHIKNSVFN